MWQEREQVITLIKDIHYASQKKYIESLSDIAGIEVFDRVQDKEDFDKFIFHELVLHQNQGLYKII